MPTKKVGYFIKSPRAFGSFGLKRTNKKVEIKQKNWLQKVQIILHQKW
jgi:hypothetical protein